ncbi:hypothetical protein Tco_0001630 [Tanacetum coccineum]
MLAMRGMVMGYGRSNKNQTSNAGNGLVQKIEDNENVQRIPRTTSNSRKTNLEELNASVIMMERIQPTDDKSDAEPTYDVEVISEDNSRQDEHDLNAHDQPYADIESMIYKVQVEAENQRKMILN